MNLPHVPHAVGQVDALGVVRSSEVENVWTAMHEPLFGPALPSRKFRRVGGAIIWNSEPEEDDVNAVDNFFHDPDPDVRRLAHWVVSVPPFGGRMAARLGPCFCLPVASLRGHR